MKVTDKMLRQYVGEARDLWLDTLPDQKEEHEFSPEFEASIREAARANSGRRKRPGIGKRILRTAACAALLMLALTAVSPSARAAIRSLIYTAKVLVTKEDARIWFESTAQPPDHLWTLTFDYFPEDFTETVREESSSGRTLIFEDGAGHRIYLDQKELSDKGGGYVSIDTKNAEVTQIKMKNGTAMQIVKGDTTKILWTEGAYLLYLDGNISTEELIKITEGIAVSE